MSKIFVVQDDKSLRGILVRDSTNNNVSLIRVSKRTGNLKFTKTTGVDYMSGKGNYKQFYKSVIKNRTVRPAEFIIGYINTFRENRRAYLLFSSGQPAEKTSACFGKHTIHRVGNIRVAIADADKADDRPLVAKQAKDTDPEAVDPDVLKGLESLLFYHEAHPDSSCSLSILSGAVPWNQQMTVPLRAIGFESICRDLHLGHFVTVKRRKGDEIFTMIRWIQTECGKRVNESVVDMFKFRKKGGRVTAKRIQFSMVINLFRRGPDFVRDFLSTRGGSSFTVVSVPDEGQSVEEAEEKIHSIVEKVKARVEIDFRSHVANPGTVFDPSPALTRIGQERYEDARKGRSLKQASYLIISAGSNFQTNTIAGIIMDKYTTFNSRVIADLFDRSIATANSFYPDEFPLFIRDKSRKAYKFVLLWPHEPFFKSNRILPQSIPSRLVWRMDESDESIVYFLPFVAKLEYMEVLYSPGDRPLVLTISMGATFESECVVHKNISLPGNLTRVKLAVFDGGYRQGPLKLFAADARTSFVRITVRGTAGAGRILDVKFFYDPIYFNPAFDPTRGSVAIANDALRSYLGNENGGDRSLEKIEGIKSRIHDLWKADRRGLRLDDVMSIIEEIGRHRISPPSFGVKYADFLNPNNYIKYVDIDHVLSTHPVTVCTKCGSDNAEHLCPKCLKRFCDKCFGSSGPVRDYELGGREFNLCAECEKSAIELSEKVSTYLMAEREKDSATLLDYDAIQFGMATYLGGEIKHKHYPYLRPVYTGAQVFPKDLALKALYPPIIPRDLYNTIQERHFEVFVYLGSLMKVSSIRLDGVYSKKNISGIEFGVQSYAELERANEWRYIDGYGVKVHFVGRFLRILFAGSAEEDNFQITRIEVKGKDQNSKIRDKNLKIRNSTLPKGSKETAPKEVRKPSRFAREFVFRIPTKSASNRGSSLFLELDFSKEVRRHQSKKSFPVYQPSALCLLYYDDDPNGLPYRTEVLKVPPITESTGAAFWYRLLESAEEHPRIRMIRAEVTLLYKISAGGEIEIAYPGSVSADIEYLDPFSCLKFRENLEEL